MLRLALPVLAEQLLHAMVMLVDVWLVGRFLKEAPELAAIGLMAYTMWFLVSLFEFVSILRVTYRLIVRVDHGDETRVARPLDVVLTT